MQIDADKVLPHYSSFHLYEMDDDYMIINPDANFWFRIAKVHLPLLQLFDGNSNVKVITEKIKTNLPADLREEYFTLLNDFVFEYPDKITQIDKQTKLSNLYLVLTSNCNSSCLYCFRETESADQPSIDKRYFLNAINSFKNISTTDAEITFTGGEPTCYNDLIELALTAKGNGIKTILQTNGLLLYTNIKLFADTFDKIHVSLDSSDESMNDWLRGKEGHFNLVSKAIESLREYNVTVKIAATITRKNVNDIKRIKKRFPGIDFQYTPMLKIGGGKNRSELSFSPEEFLETLKALPHGIEEFGFRLPQFGVKSISCGVGTSLLSISPGGDVYPCQMLHHDSLKCGNIIDMSLEEIYIDSPVLKRFREFTIDDIEECQSCDIRYICGGGCIANGFWQNYNLFDKDYFCEFNRNIIFYNMFNQFEKVLVKTNDS